MNRGRRTIRLAKWAGVGLCVVIAATWAVSMWWGFGLYLGPITAGCEYGWFGLLRDEYVASDFGWLTYHPWPGALALREHLWTDPLADIVSTIMLPLWLPLALLAFPTVWLFWLDRRKPRPAFCACGYDLTGNVSGVCPECGVGVR